MWIRGCACFLIFAVLLCNFAADMYIHVYFDRATRCISAVFAVMQCLSVCLSVTFVHHVKTNKHIFKIFSPSGSDTILVFPIFRRDPPNRGVECKGGYDDFRPISRSISETVIVRWPHAVRQFVSIEFSFHPYNI